MGSVRQIASHARAALIALLLCTAIAVVAEAESHRYAVVVGINKYSSPRWHTLGYAEADARAVAAILKTQGFQVTELYSLDAKKQNILDALYKAAAGLGQDDSFLFFYAGHGASERVGSDMWGYLVPSDGTNAASYISNDELQSVSRRMQVARHQLFILDACYAGLMVTRSGGVDPSIPNYIEEVQARSSREVLAAGGGNQEVVDVGTDGHSVFTSALLRGLAGDADLNRDGFITFPELQAFVTPLASNAYQTPSGGVLPGHAGGEFVFRSPKGGTAAPGSPVPKGTARRGDDDDSALPTPNDLSSGTDPGKDPLAKAKDLLANSRFTEAFVAFSNAAGRGNSDAMVNVGQIYENGWGVLQDYGQARQWYEKAAGAGNTDAMKDLGNLFNEAHGVPQDYDQARQWYQKGADAGNFKAMTDLGNLYARGSGVTRDYGQARQWYEKGANGGEPVAMLNLGALYASGHGVTQDFAQARQWFLKAVAKGENHAMNRLGALYYDGAGVDRDYNQAREWFEKGAAAGNTTSMKNLGLLYERGQGVTRDYAQARQWFEKAAAAGNADAMFDLAEMYRKGLGVPVDHAVQREWFEKAAAAGNVAAMTDLGQMYTKGVIVPKSYEQALQWWLKAALGGEPVGMANLGWLYESGNGVTQDYAKARQWYEKSAEAGCPAGMNHLGHVYANGKGVPVDFNQARQWWEKSAAKGDPNAMRSLAGLYRDGKGVHKDQARAQQLIQQAEATEAKEN